MNKLRLLVITVVVLGLTILPGSVLAAQKVAIGFVAKDRADAVVDGVQTVPGAEYLVLGVRGGRVTEVKRFRLDGGAFVESGLG